MKKVSVIIPLYNKEQYIEDCIRSVLLQTYPDIEVIIVDDGSTDSSVSIVNKYKSGGVKLVSQTNKGASAARNTGLRHATGEYVQFLDADDTLDPYKIEAQMKCFEGSKWNEGMLVFGKWSRSEDIEDVPASQKSIYHTYENPVDVLIDIAILNTYIAIHAYLLPMSLIKKAGGWDEELSRNDDGEFMARVLKEARLLMYCDEGTAFYRNVSESLSKQASNENMSSYLESNIRICEIISASDHYLARHAVCQRMNKVLFTCYPYNMKYWNQGKDYLLSKYPDYMIRIIPLNWKEKTYFILFQIAKFFCSLVGVKIYH